ncbi:lysis system i-spanin subunit Rz [Pseudomonas viridiflava]|uniref:lysis system i-spanin subunit Rz n=1 Tax=Pseudomonas viridiflava TaxID=33069 RepID=UPI000F05D41A|nr:lysis system i-spanin subunit Rz [Pseudomonas viridiflava]
MSAFFKWIPVWGWVLLALLTASGYLALRLDAVTADRDVVALERDAEREKVRRLTAANESRKKTQKLLLDLDTRHTQEQARADEQNDAMLAAVATGARRVYVNARCPAVRTSASTARQPDEESRAQLDPAVAERILHTGVDGDDAIRQLSALQEYVEKVCLGPAG